MKKIILLVLLVMVFAKTACALNYGEDNLFYDNIASSFKYIDTKNFDVLVFDTCSVFDKSNNIDEECLDYINELLSLNKKIVFFLNDNTLGITKKIFTKEKYADKDLNNLFVFARTNKTKYNSKGFYKFLRKRFGLKTNIIAFVDTYMSTKKTIFNKIIFGIDVKRGVPIISNNKNQPFTLMHIYLTNIIESQIKL